MTENPFYEADLRGMPKCEIPAGESGNWKIKKFEIKDDPTTDIYNMQEIFSGNGHRMVVPGHYTKLLNPETKTLMMTDTSWELNLMRDFVYHAKDHVLINGLGLGCSVEAVFRKCKNVTKVTVIEISPDVITLVAPFLQDKYGDALEIINDDALTWRPTPNAHYGAIWHDIWPVIDLANKPEITKLMRSYGRRTEWQSYWGKFELDRMMKEERSRSWF